MNKLVNGQLVDLSPADIEQRDADAVRVAAEKPLRDWEAKMADTDDKLPRYVEDIIDALDKPTRDKIAKRTIDAYTEKKVKRAEKPL